MREIYAFPLKSPRIIFANIKFSITSYKSFLHVISPNDFQSNVTYFRHLHQMSGNEMSGSELLCTSSEKTSRTKPTNLKRALDRGPGGR